MLAPGSPGQAFDPCHCSCGPQTDLTGVFIPWKVLDACWQPLTCHMVSIRIQQPDEINTNHMNDDVSDWVTPEPVKDSINRNSKWVIFRPDYIIEGNREEHCRGWLMLCLLRE